MTIKTILRNPRIAILYSTLIFILCVMPSENIPEDVDDKMAHFIAFAGVSFFWLWAKPSFFKVILGSIAFGFVIEFIQGVLPENFHRSYDIYDGIADAIGVLIGAGLFYLSMLILKE